MLRQYFNCNGRLEIFLTYFCNILCYVGSVTIEGNPILFDCSSKQFAQNFGISQPSAAFLNIECKKYKNLETKCVRTSPGLPYKEFSFG